ncbi:hypothetical protein ACJIZ3_023004 [Penstemon smallii]|uniref:C2 domain-containing protein n=1 Tax=Penstemon smallii TaxID=265156 RepID=A0ABD3TQS8_9LAMI
MTTINGIMEVTLVSARGLKDTEIFGKVDPYVVLEYKSQQQKSSTGRGKASRRSHMKWCMCLRGQGTSPVWNEKFKFKVEYPAAGAGEQEQYKLLLKVVDHDNFTNDDCLGQATIYLKELFERGLEKGNAEIPTQKYRVVSEDKSYNGEIQVGITFTTKVETDEKEYGGWKESQY